MSLQVDGLQRKTHGAYYEEVTALKVTKVDALRDGTLMTVVFPKALQARKPWSKHGFAGFVSTPSQRGTVKPGSSNVHLACTREQDEYTSRIGPT